MVKNGLWGNGMHNVDRENPCFCGCGLDGRERQCSWGINEYGHRFYCCCKSAQGHAEQKGIAGDTAIGIDGEKYVCTGKSKSGYMRFWIRESDRRAEKEAWLEEQRALHPEKYRPKNGDDPYAARKKMFRESAERFLTGLMTDRYAAAGGLVTELRKVLRKKTAVDDEIYSRYADLCCCVYEAALPREKVSIEKVMELTEKIRLNRAGTSRGYALQTIEQVPDEFDRDSYYRLYVLYSVILGLKIKDDAAFTEDDFSFVRNAMIQTDTPLCENLVWRSADVSKAADVKKEDEPDVASAQKRDRVYRAFLSELHYEPRHMHNRMSEGWSYEDIEKAGLRSMPIPSYIVSKYGQRNKFSGTDPKVLCRKLQERLGKDALSGVPGFYTDGKDGAWTFRSISGEVLPMYDPEGRIIQLRIRLDYFDCDYPFDAGSDHEKAYITANGRRFLLDVKGFQDITDPENPVKVDSSVFGKSGKTRSFTSWFQADDGTNSLKNGTRAGDECSVYTEPGDDEMFFWITEGERKAKVCNLKNKQRCISIPGVGKYLLPEKRGYIDALKEKGAAGVIVAFDADRVSNQNVRSFEEKLIRHLEEKGLFVQVAVWDPSEGKGIDDLYLNGGTPDLVFSDEYLEKGLEYFLERRKTG